jgi:hypothetical protein
MICGKEKGPAGLLIAIFTGIAVMSGFFVTAVEDVPTAGFADTGGKTGYGEIDSHITTPADEPALFRKTVGPRVAPLRTGFQRIFSPCGIHSAASTYCRSYVGTIPNINFTPVKKTILLKLRI